MKIKAVIPISGMLAALDLPSTLNTISSINLQTPTPFSQRLATTLLWIYQGGRAPINWIRWLGIYVVFQGNGAATSHLPLSDKAWIKMTEWTKGISESQRTFWDTIHKSFFTPERVLSSSKSMCIFVNVFLYATMFLSWNPSQYLVVCSKVIFTVFACTFSYSCSRF